LQGARLQRKPVHETHAAPIEIARLDRSRLGKTAVFFPCAICTMPGTSLRLLITGHIKCSRKCVTTLWMQRDSN
jgi:hypothetical protein